MAVRLRNHTGIAFFRRFLGERGATRRLGMDFRLAAVCFFCATIKNKRDKRAVRKA